MTASDDVPTSSGGGDRVKAAAGLLLAAMLAACSPGGGAKAAGADRPTPSGLPVPRYVSLKFNEVNARAAPGDESRLLWTYHVKGLPLQVVAENAEWRRVCDPDHGMAWVHKRTTDGRRTVLRNQPTPLPIRARASADAHVVAYMAGRSLGALDGCSRGWCKVKVGPAEGWAPMDQLWGADEAVQCK